MGRKLHLTPGLHVYLAAALLILPFRWLLAAVAAAAMHELFHWAAIRLLGHPVHSIRIGFLGARIVTEPMPRRHELLCTLAGPLGGLCLLPLAKWLGAVSICAAFQSLYNLLPVYPADGGRALRCSARMLMPEYAADKLVYWVETAVLSTLAAMGIWAWFALGLGPLPLAAASVLVYRGVQEK